MPIAHCCHSAVPCILNEFSLVVFQWSRVATSFQQQCGHQNVPSLCICRYLLRVRCLGPFHEICVYTYIHTCISTHAHWQKRRQSIAMKIPWDSVSLRCPFGLWTSKANMLLMRWIVPTSKKLQLLEAAKINYKIDIIDITSELP